MVFLALSVSDAAEDVITVIRAGARGYVTKTISGQELGDAMRRSGRTTPCSRRGWPASCWTCSPTGPGFTPPGDPELDLLTRRERDVLRLLARGHAYKETAGSCSSL